MSLLVTAMTLAVGAQTATVMWDSIPDTSVVSYNVYYKTSTSSTWTTTNVVGRLNNSAALSVQPLLVYQYYVTAMSDTGIETEPSNQVRFQYFHVNASKPTSLTLGDVGTANFPSFVLITNTVAGTLTGTAPSVTFTPTLSGFKKDSFVYKSPELYQGLNVTNYYAVTKLPFGAPNVKNVGY